MMLGIMDKVTGSDGLSVVTCDTVVARWLLPLNDHSQVS
jgi:hypothetical protein